MEAFGYMTLIGACFETSMLSVNEKFLSIQNQLRKLLHIVLHFLCYGLENIYFVQLLLYFNI